LLKSGSALANGRGYERRGGFAPLSRPYAQNLIAGPVRKNNPMLNPGPQAEAPANEGAARVGGEPPSFQYPHCDRVLTTASGRGLHVRRAHLAEFNNAINIERVHAQWSLEEKFDGEA
jgi:hypothetical protein